jgi:hypothetical protein
MNNLNLGLGLCAEGNKKLLCDPKTTEMHCNFLLQGENLKEIIEATRAPVRKSYRKELRRQQTKLPAREEYRLERVLWLRWRPYLQLNTKKNSIEPKGAFLNGVAMIMTYQLPLFNMRAKDGWGAVDLVGISTKTKLPVVIELKAGDSKESPLRMLLEAAAYGICLRKAWGGKFCDDWNDALNKCNKGWKSEQEFNSCQLVCAAPDEYWNRWLEGADRLPANAWQGINAVAKKLNTDHRLAAQFQSISFKATPFLMPK